MRAKTPWRIHPTRPCDIMDADGVIFATVAYGRKEEAALIAAAPELLTALHDCVLVMERDLNGLTVIQTELQNARAAIAKATWIEA